MSSFIAQRHNIGRLGRTICNKDDERIFRQRQSYRCLERLYALGSAFGESLCTQRRNVGRLRRAVCGNCHEHAFILFHGV